MASATSGNKLVGGAELYPQFINVQPDHGTELCQRLFGQWKASVCCDLTLCLQGGQLPVHSCVLAACSPRMKSLLLAPATSQSASASVSQRANADSDSTTTSQSRHTTKSDSANLPQHTSQSRSQQHTSHSSAGGTRRSITRSSKVTLNFDLQVVEVLVTRMYTGVLNFDLSLLPSVLATARWLQMEAEVRVCLEYGHAFSQVDTVQQVAALREVDSECDVETSMSEDVNTSTTSEGDPVILEMSTPTLMKVVNIDNNEDVIVMEDDGLVLTEVDANTNSNRQDDLVLTVVDFPNSASSPQGQQQQQRKRKRGRPRKVSPSSSSQQTPGKSRNVNPTTVSSHVQVKVEEDTAMEPYVVFEAVPGTDFGHPTQQPPPVPQRSRRKRKESARAKQRSDIKKVQRKTASPTTTLRETKTGLSSLAVKPEKKSKSRTVKRKRETDLLTSARKVPKSHSHTDLTTTALVEVKKEAVSPEHSMDSTTFPEGHSAIRPNTNTGSLLSSIHNTNDTSQTETDSLENLPEDSLLNTDALEAVPEDCMPDAGALEAVPEDCVPDMGIMSHMQWVEAHQGSAAQSSGQEADFALGKTDHVRCRKCLARFTDLDLYLSHVTHHPTFQCGHCSVSYPRMANLTRHMRTAHPEVCHLQCQRCAFLAPTERVLRSHFRQQHGGDKPFVCQHPGCTYSSRNVDFLRRHALIHKEVKSYTCTKCGQSFSQSGGLASHQKTCYQLRQYLCDLCGQPFNHLQSMQSHRRTVHFGEKPHVCGACGKQFSDHRNMKRHMLIHDNSFPYVCPLCQQQFRHSNSLKSHLKKQHGEQGGELLAQSVVGVSVVGKEKQQQQKSNGESGGGESGGGGGESGGEGGGGEVDADMTMQQQGCLVDVDSVLNEQGRDSFQVDEEELCIMNSVVVVEKQPNDDS